MTVKKSFMSGKYASSSYTGSDKEGWFRKFIDSVVYVDKVPAVYETQKDEDGTERKVLVSKTVPAYVDIDKLYDLARANGITKFSIPIEDARKAVGRARMTVGNSLSAEARRRGGLMNLNGEFVKADSVFMTDKTGNPIVPTKNPDGTPIVKIKQDVDRDDSDQRKVA